MGKRSTRQSNIELLRIASMLLIVIHHLCLHTPWPKVGILANTTVIHVLALGGKVGVCCFVMITGYFAIRSRFKCKSLLRVILQTWFYSWAIFGLFAVLDPGAIPKDFTLSALFPICYCEYWFITCYVVLIMLAPAINLMITGMSPVARLRFLTLSIIVFSLIPTITGKDFVFSNFVFFICLYAVGAEMRLIDDGSPDGSAVEKLHPIMRVINPVVATRFFKPWVMCVLSLLFIAVSVVCIDYARTYYGFNLLAPGYFEVFNSLPIVFLSVGLFAWFKNRDIGSKKTINTMASCVLGVYLIHENPLIRSWLWSHIAPIYALPFWQLALAVIGIAVCVYLVCSGIDLVRQKLLEAPLFKLIERVFGSTLERIDAWFRANDESAA